MTENIEVAIEKNGFSEMAWLHHWWSSPLKVVHQLG